MLQPDMHIILAGFDHLSLPQPATLVDKELKEHSYQAWGQNMPNYRSDFIFFVAYEYLRMIFFPHRERPFLIVTAKGAKNSQHSFLGVSERIQDLTLSKVGATPLS